MEKPTFASNSIINQFRRHYLIASILPIICLLILMVTGIVLTQNYLARLIKESTHDLNQDAKRGLQQLGEDIIMAKAKDVARQIEMYFRMHPNKTFPEMRKDPLFRELAIQKVGKTGYTALTEVNTWLFLVHPNAKLNDTDMRPLAKKMPDWWKIIEKAVAAEVTNSGYYKWREPDGSFRDKFMVVTPISVKHRGITIWVSATTYIDEFSVPVLKMQHKADTVVSNYQQYVSRQLSWFSGFAGLIILLTFLGIYIWGRRAGLRYIVPITQLAENAKHLGEGNWDVQLPDHVLQRDDEVGVMAQSFTRMSGQLKETFSDLEERVTELKQTRDALKTSEEHYRSLFEGIPVGLYRSSPGGKFLDVNLVMAKNLGYPDRESLLATNVKDLYFTPEERADWMARMKESGGVQAYEMKLRKYDGTQIWVENSSRTVYDESGAVLYYEGSLKDTTERRLADDALKKSEEMLRLITENMSDMIRVTDLQGSNIYVSPSHFKGLGYRIDERIGKSVFDIVHPDDIEAISNKFAEGLARNQPMRHEYRVRHADGHYVWLETVADLLRDAQGKATAVVMSSRDISDQKRAEEALQKSEQRYRSLVENADEVILVIQDGMIKFANNRAVGSFGYSEEELLSIPAVELIHPEDREIVREQYLQKMNSETTATRHTFRAIRKSGRILWIEISSVLIDWEGRTAILNLISDITERRKAEEERQSLAERLQRAEKMEALGQLAGGVAHDLNNVLGILSGYSELLLVEIPEGQRARGYIEKILQSTEKGAAIIQDLLTLARRGVTVSDVINLNDIVSGFLKTPVFEKLKDYHPQVTFRTEYDRHLLNIKGSPVHLEKTIMNLISNAAEAITGQGKVTIRTESRYLDKAVSGYDEVREGDYTILTVSDTGMGIPAEHREKIFEPFYTKKTMGRSGTGLGLAIVWGTVKDHHGYIDIQTKVGEGAAITLYFPATREELTAPQQKEPVERYMGKGESVLVVDDIAEQRDVASGLLRQLGYQVNTVSSGEEAVEYLKGNNVDVLVLDMIMAPGIDGLETYERAIEVNPRQKAILVSGFSETDRVREAQKLGAGAYVKKPYVMEKIGVAIRDELNPMAKAKKRS